MILLSVVVPVYSVEKYIGSFLSSLLPQLNDQVELIIVNDDTPDNSIKIVNSYIEKYPNLNINLISQDNMGLSGARNSGLKLSVAEYVSFIDPDDIVSGNYIDVILRQIKSQRFDILTFNANRIDMDGDYISDCIVCSQNKDHDSQLRDVFNRGRWYAWARVFRKEIISGVGFPVGKRFEDLLTVPSLYMKSSSIINLSDSLISYRVNPNGITMNPKVKDLHDVEEFTRLYFEKVKSFQRNKSHGADDSNTAELYMATYISGVRTLFYLSNDLYGPLKSFFYLRDFILFNFKLPISKLKFFNRNNKIFIKFIVLHYAYYTALRIHKKYKSSN